MTQSAPVTIREPRGSGGGTDTACELLDRYKQRTRSPYQSCVQYQSSNHTAASAPRVEKFSIGYGMKHVGKT